MLNGRFINPGYEYTYQDWVIGIIKTEDLESLLENGKLSQLDYDTIQHLQERKESVTPHYQYTYQDWLDGEIEPVELVSLYNDEEISSELYTKILEEQDKAFLKRLVDSLEALKRDFLSYYNESLVKEEYLNAWIKKTDLSVQAIRQDKEDIYLDAITGDDGRRNLTAKLVSEYLSYDLDKASLFDIHFTLLRDIIYDNTPFTYILKVNYLRWLNWLKDQNSQDKSEPVINMLSRTADRDLKEIKSILGKEGKSYNWLSEPDTELPELYQHLIAKQLIHPDTTEEQLKAVFTAQPLQAVQPVKWHDENASELLYFILQLENSESIEAGKQTNYLRLKTCFVRPDGSPFNSAFKSLKQRIEIDLSEQKQQTIKSIINSFL